MNTTYNTDPTTQPNLKKLAAGVLLAGGLAVMGLGAGPANADPDNTSRPTCWPTACTGPSPSTDTMTCPETVTTGQSGSVTVAGFQAGNPIFVSDGPNLVKYGGIGWGNNNGAIAVVWPGLPLGPHTLTAWQISQSGSATCTVIVEGLPLNTDEGSNGPPSHFKAPKAPGNPGIHG
ncbi:MAG TPA: hypothetical protein VN888_26115 [Mycobacterium sp.]|nr:hypothetical protein [Mycobacterium sp.]